MSIKTGRDGKLYYYTTSTDDYQQQWYTIEDSNSLNYIQFPKLKEFDDHIFDMDWGATELKYSGHSKKKKNHYLEDDLFEI